MKLTKKICTGAFGLLLAASLYPFKPLSVQAQTSSRQNLLFVGIVRNNVGTLYRFTASNATFAGNAKWDTCPQGTKLIARDFQVNGFWLCASPDIASRNPFYFGNIVNNKSYYWEISNGRSNPAGNAEWGTCWEGSLRATLYTPNGFWVCQP